jgi:DNA primase
MAAVSFPAGQDAAQVLQARSPDALAALLSQTRPLADLVIDAQVDRWDRWLQYAEGQIRALRAAAPLIAAMPPKDVARQVARLAERLGLDHSIVTGAVTDALPDVIAAGKMMPARRGAAPQSRLEIRGEEATRTAGLDFPRPAQQAIGRTAHDRSPRGGAPRPAEPRLRGGRVTG